MKIWQFLRYPHGKDRLYYGWFMFVLGCMMTVCTVMMVIRQRYGVAAWDFMCMLIDFFCTWLHWSIYNDWKKSHTPLTKT